jgi:alkaline phosphatase D
MRLLLFIFISLVGPYCMGEEIQRIAFGSCSHQDKPQPIWEEVLAADPDLFIFLGDNIYGDSDDPAVLAAKYQTLYQQPGIRRLLDTTDVVATWDDHDYGRNDAGQEYPAKEASRRAMLDFWGEPAGTERRTRDSGIYTSYMYGEEGKRVQVILLDLRWNRTELVEIVDPAKRSMRTAANRGPYEVSLSAQAQMLGEEQWLWLEQQLLIDADLRLIGSSIQLLAEFTGWETWANYPKDRQRFFELLEQYQREPIVILSGDVHWSEFSRIDETANEWPLLEITSSGLTEEWKAISPNRHRVGEAFAVANFGLLEIDWSDGLPSIEVIIRDVSGADLIRRTLTF